MSRSGSFTHNLSIAPVQIPWGDRSTLYSITGLSDWLANSFPIERRGREYETALFMCHELLMGKNDATPDQAREAFIAAVHKIGLTVFPDR